MFAFYIPFFLYLIMTPKEIPFQKKELVIVVHNQNNLPTIDFHQLKELQGDLKITTPAKIEKLKNSIRKYGIFVPKFVWINDGTYYIEDGHQTIKALTELEQNGYDIPAIPYVIIEAKARKEAGEKLLMINSRFADFNLETSFFKDFDIGLEFMDEIEIDDLKTEVGDEKTFTLEDFIFEDVTMPCWFVVRSDITNYQKIKEHIEKLKEIETTIIEDSNDGPY